MRRLAIPFAIAAIALDAPAAAVAPCDDVCHLAQGQPLLIADARQVWVRRCVIAKDGAETCVVQRTDLQGKVLAERPAPTLFDHDFARLELAGKPIVRLDWQAAWADLTRPHEIDPGGLKVGLSLDRDALVISPAGSQAVRRPLGCVPHTVHVFAARGHGHGAVVAIAACPSPGGGEREVPAACEIAAPHP